MQPQPLFHVLFVVKEHGVPETLISQTFALSRALFSIPLEEKKRIIADKNNRRDIHADAHACLRYYLTVPFLSACFFFIQGMDSFPGPRLSMDCILS